jgi:GTP-sensing pleiotropic transcriptional regulator CodY
MVLFMTTTNLVEAIKEAMPISKAIPVKLIAKVVMARYGCTYKVFDEALAKMEFAGDVEFVNGLHPSYRRIQKGGI